MEKRKIEEEIEEMEKELQKWEQYNNKENDILRNDIKLKKDYLKRYIKKCKKLNIKVI